MVGRIDPKREGDRNYIYLIGSDKLSTELHNISEEMNKKNSFSEIYRIGMKANSQCLRLTCDNRLDLRAAL